ncbi:NB-ARC domain containing protein [Trema orientale]|uniref:NB-ARC domain containing protein n=1 Tax=Trema orientale TaxID=63057 RepID=A0A2P5FLS6_TREOI|nr:NB-ARC domain containing protein [Trema orientale]
MGDYDGGRFDIQIMLAVKSFNSSVAQDTKPDTSTTGGTSNSLMNPATILGLETKLQTLQNLKNDTNKEFVGAEIDRLTSKLDKGGLPLPPRLVGNVFEQTVDAVCQWVENDPDVSVIGLWGSEGLGKTAVARHIHAKLDSHPDFFVSWVDVPPAFSIDDLQNEIAESLHVDISYDVDHTKRMTQLLKPLEAYKTAFKKSVLILDSVSTTPIPPDQLGIPSDSCTIILTTRSLELCQLTGCQKTVQLEPLSFEDSWELFVEKHGTAILPRLDAIARSIVRECDGVPLGIVTLARCLSLKHVFKREWNAALGKLTAEGGGGGVDQSDPMPTKLFRILRCCYDLLKDWELQRCFIYCGLHAEDSITTRDLMMFSLIDDGVIYSLSLPTTIKKGHEILNKLEDLCLVEGGTDLKGRKYVFMNKSLSDLAMKIAKSRYFLK